MTPVVVDEKRWLPTFGLALAVIAIVLANTWIDTDPDGLARAAGTMVLTTLAGGAIWCGLWALLSKTFTRQSHFGWHVRVFVIASLAHARPRRAAAAARVRVLLAVGHRLQLRRRLRDGRRGDLLPPARGRAGARAPDARRRRDRLRRRRRPLALVQRAAHRPAGRGALHEPPVPAAAARRQAEAGRHASSTAWRRCRRSSTARRRSRAAAAATTRAEATMKT